MPSYQSRKLRESFFSPGIFPQVFKQNHQLGSPAPTGFHQDIGNMRLDRGKGHEEAVGDFLVTQSLENKLQYFLLPLAEPIVFRNFPRRRLRGGFGLHPELAPQPNP